MATNAIGSVNTTSNSGAEHYKLPDGVKMILDATVQQATAFSIVLALFAGALTSLAQNVADRFDAGDSPASWKALRIFLYSAIMLNLSGAFQSLMVIKMCTDLPLTIYESDRRPSNCRKLSASGLLRDHYMSTSYWLVGRSFIVVSILACMCTFVTFSFWIFLSESFTVAWVTMIVFSLLAINATLVFFTTVRGQGWS